MWIYSEMTAMPAIKHKDTILNVIDQLRNRKARPDLEHICHMVKRKHGLCASETEAVLEKLVESELVIKVEYKGSTSYRNAAKWKRSRIGGNVLNSNETTVYLQQAIDSICIANNERDGSASQCGASVEQIRAWIEQNAENASWLKKHINTPGKNLVTALDREVDVGKIEKLRNGNYIINVRPPLTIKERLDRKSASLVTAAKKSLSTQSGRVVKKGRPPGSINKKKNLKNDIKDDIFDRKIKRELSPASDTSGTTIIAEYDSDVKCRLCSMTSSEEINGRKDGMLTCKDCSGTVHPVCMNYSAELTRRALRSPWQCYECKTCCLCSEAGEAAELLLCDSCDKGYHMQCHKPRITKNPTGIWECTACLRERENPMDSSDDEAMDACNTVSEGGGPSCLPTPCDSPVEFCDQPKKCGDLDKDAFMESLMKKVGADEIYGEDTAEWSIEDVADYVKNAGFEEQAKKFADQEIDGRSLLLMQRNDVLTGLSIKLGPALKIYNHVHKLQSASAGNV